MSLKLPIIFLLLGLGLILISLCGVIVWTIRASLRLRKMEIPKLKFLFFVAFLQVLLGVMAVFIVRAIKNEPVLAIGTGLGTVILSGPVFIKFLLKKNWGQSIRIWVIAAAIQLLLVPLISVVTSVVWVMLSYWLFPPQY